MKTLLFFRHGKSDWDADFDHDHERPLAKRGRKAARLMGRFLTEAGVLPDHIVTSSALRTRQTLERAQQAGTWQATVQVAEALYEASPDDVLGVIRAVPETAATLMLVGHEPTSSETIARLIGDAVDLRFPTAALACVDLDVARWQDVDFGDGQLRWLVPPKLLSGRGA